MHARIESVSTEPRLLEASTLQLSAEIDLAGPAANTASTLETSQTSETPDRAESGGSYGPFAYLNTPSSSLYRRVMRALVAEKQRVAVHVQPEQICERLRTDGGDAVDETLVSEMLERLAQPSWGNLLAFPDSSRVTALEDFYRRRMLYQLSREGEAVAAVQAAFVTESQADVGKDELQEVSTREAWAAAGIVMSNVASAVLCLGVPGAFDNGAGADDRESLDSGGTRSGSLAKATSLALESMREARAPLLLTLDQVRSRGVGTVPRESVVFVCENPTIVEVIAQGWSQLVAGGSAVETAANPVLVCTSGQASRASIELIQLLTANGAECRYHGDFDWAGLRIAQTVRSHVSWVSWRFDATDYLAAVASVGSAVALKGLPAESSWDPELSRAMRQHGLAVEEEHLFRELLRDFLEQAASRAAQCGEQDPDERTSDSMAG